MLPIAHTTYRRWAETASGGCRWRLGKTASTALPEGHNDAAVAIDTGRVALSAVHADIKKICAKGDALAERKLFEEAIKTYNTAWKLVPGPQTDWAVSTWILAAIGDACFLGGFFTSGAEALEYAMRCPDGFGNPFLHLRLGQCALERGQDAVAADHLARAYMLEGKEIFALDDPKYFAFLKTKIAPPASGVW